VLYSYVHVTFYWSTNSIVLEWYELIGVNLKKTIDYLRAAWNSVTAVTIKNYFCKAGFTDTVAIDDESIAFEGFTDNDLMDDLGWLLEDTHITFDQFVGIDDDVETYEMPTDEEIIAMSITEVEAEEKSDDDEDEVLTPVCPTPFSATTAIEAVSTFSDFHETCENVPETVYDCVAQLKDFASQSYAKRCRQSKITDFFVVRRLKNADAYFTSEQ